MNATLLLAAALSLAGARAQDPPAQPQVVSFEHDGGDLTGFVVYAIRQEDGRRRRFDVGLPQRTPDGGYRVPIPALEDGTWRILVAAYNAVGESSPVAADAHLTIGDPGTVRPAPPPDDDEPAGRPAEDGVLRKLWRIIVG